MRVTRTIEVEGDPTWVRRTLHSSLVRPGEPFICANGRIREVRRDQATDPEPIVQVSFIHGNELGQDRWDFLDGLADKHGRFLNVGDRVLGIQTKYGEREGVVVGVSERRTQEDWDGPLTTITEAVCGGRRYGRA